MLSNKEVTMKKEDRPDQQVNINSNETRKNNQASDRKREKKETYCSKIHFRVLCLNP
jgi:hypothetical protein